MCERCSAGMKVLLEGADMVPSFDGILGEMRGLCLLWKKELDGSFIQAVRLEAKLNAMEVGWYSYDSHIYTTSNSYAYERNLSWKPTVGVLV